MPVDEDQNRDGKIVSQEIIEETNNTVTYKIEFEPSQDIFSFGTNPLHLVDELKSMGETIVVAHIDKIPSLEVIDPEKIYIYWDIVLTTSAGINAIKDVFMFVEDDSKINIEIIDEKGRLRNESYKAKIEELLVNKKELKVENLIEPDDATGSNKEKKKETVNKNNGKSNLSAARIKVDSEKLDALVNLVGELVTVQAHLAQTVAGKSDPELFSIGEEVERLTWNLRDNVLRMRMIPIGTTRPIKRTWQKSSIRNRRS